MDKIMRKNCYIIINIIKHPIHVTDRFLHQPAQSSGIRSNDLAPLLANKCYLQVLLSPSSGAAPIVHTSLAPLFLYHIDSAHP